MEQELIDLLKRTGALITDDHLVGTSGRHMSVYINKDMLLMHPAETSKVGALFAQKVKDIPIDVVIGPAMGAIVLAQWTAFHLATLTRTDILSVYTDKMYTDGHETGHMLKRGYDKVIAGKNVLIVEDTTTTGGSVVKVAEVVRAAGGTVVQICVMVNRDPEQITAETMGAPFSWIASIEAQSYVEEECPLCKAGVPVNISVGHGKKFLESRA